MVIDSRSREVISSEEKKIILPYNDPRNQYPFSSPSCSEGTSVASPSRERGPIPTISVDQIHLQTGPKPLTGTFYIDPRVSLLDVDAKASRIQKKNHPHASFRTGGGAISLDLGTTGDVNDGPKALVLVSSRTGNIIINLLSIPRTKPRIELEVFSRKGDIILYLPDTFCGMIQLSTRRGNLQFLPAMAALMRILNHTDDEALVLIGNQSLSKSNPYDTQALDFCQLNSSDGKLIVGLSGQDRHYEPKGGFWKNLESMFGETH